MKVGFAQKIVKGGWFNNNSNKIVFGDYSSNAGIDLYTGNIECKSELKILDEDYNF